jgi:hypothetical protein
MKRPPRPKLVGREQNEDVILSSSRPSAVNEAPSQPVAMQLTDAGRTPRVNSCIMPVRSAEMLLSNGKLSPHVNAR